MKWVAFLRGINVGGHHKIPMADLRALMSNKLGARGVSSYIASGNLVFAADDDRERLVSAIEGAIEQHFGFRIPVLLFSEQDMRDVLKGCPFLGEKGNSVHGFLCFDTPQVVMQTIDQLRAETEKVVTVGKTVWLFAPEGIGRSKLVAKLDLGVEMTARNLNTISKMVEMLDG